VIDDPISILRCTNKVFLAELFDRHEIPHPETVVAHEDTVEKIAATVGLPCVLKRPDSAFSQGVVRVDTEAELLAAASEFLRDSQLVIAQAFTPSEFDWRIGVLGGEPLFVCRYHMARGHWQIVAHEGGGKRRYGRVEAVAVEDAPAEAVRIGVRAARLIGDGLYGVDVKEYAGRFLVMEVNDNPNIESGCEDAIIGDRLYQEVMNWFRRRLDARGSENGGNGNRAR
jgi:glutathione synthase/RimK-type ligase-like ATP-grasp enzyme